MAWIVVIRWWSRERDCERENTGVTVGLLGVGCYCWPMGGDGGLMMESALWREKGHHSL